MKTLIIGDSKIVKQVSIGPDLPLVLIGGPCAIETREHTFQMAESILEVCEQVGIPLIFKACYDKDCRSSAKSFHGVGIEPGLEILNEVRHKYKVPVTCDFSDASWGSQTGEVVDLLQIPAYLCRQTTVLRAAGQTGRPVNIKKGQFMSPWNMRNSAKKIKELTGNDQIMFSERGTFFGYNMLVNDYRALEIMQNIGYPVCYDATHSIQMPTSDGSISGGQREFIPGLVRAACASGIQALFMEVHDNPDKAWSDPATQLPLKFLKNILIHAKAMHEKTLELIQQTGKDNVT